MHLGLKFLDVKFIWIVLVNDNSYPVSLITGFSDAPISPILEVGEGCDGI